jgi:hypothetical protein
VITLHARPIASIQEKFRLPTTHSPPPSVPRKRNRTRNPAERFQKPTVEEFLDVFWWLGCRFEYRVKTAAFFLDSTLLRILRIATACDSRRARTLWSSCRIAPGNPGIEILKALHRPPRLHGSLFSIYYPTISYT